MSETPTHSPPVRRRGRWWRPLLLVVVAFVCGAVVGGGLTARFILNRFIEGFQQPAVVADRIVGRMDTFLDLDDEQQAAVRNILDTQVDEIVAIRNDTIPEVLAVLRAGRDEVAEVLTPEQRELWLQRWGNVAAVLVPQDFRDEMRAIETPPAPSD